MIAKLVAGLTVVLLLAALIIGFREFFDSQLPQKAWAQEPWRQCDFALPDERGHVMLFIQKAHPFLAEYRQKLRVQNAGGEEKELSLNTNTGGCTMANFYLFADNKHSILSAEGNWFKVSIDLANLQTLDEHNLSPKKYLGRCDDRDQTSHFRFVSAEEAKEEMLPHPTGG